MSENLVIRNTYMDGPKEIRETTVKVASINERY